MSDTFRERTAATGGPLINDYLWSNVATWTTGVVPVDGDSVVANSTGYDDLASLSLTSLTSLTRTAQSIGNGFFAQAALGLTGGSLSIGTVYGTQDGDVLAFGEGVGATTRGGRGVIDVPIDHPALVHGWHQPGSDGARLWRWTDGDAVLPLPPGTEMVEFHVAGSNEYPLSASQAAGANERGAERAHG